MNLKDEWEHYNTAEQSVLFEANKVVMKKNYDEMEAQNRCDLARWRVWRWICEPTERPSGRAKECPVEHGNKCPMEVEDGREKDNS